MTCKSVPKNYECDGPDALSYSRNVCKACRILAKSGQKKSPPKKSSGSFFSSVCKKEAIEDDIFLPLSQKSKMPELPKFQAKLNNNPDWLDRVQSHLKKMGNLLMVGDYISNDPWNAIPDLYGLKTTGVMGFGVEKNINHWLNMANNISKNYRRQSNKTLPFFYFSNIKNKFVKTKENRWCIWCHHSAALCLYLLRCYTVNVPITLFSLGDPSMDGHWLIIVGDYCKGWETEKASHKKNTTLLKTKEPFCNLKLPKNATIVDLWGGLMDIYQGNCNSKQLNVLFNKTTDIFANEKYASTWLQGYFNAKGNWVSYK